MIRVVPFALVLICVLAFALRAAPTPGHAIEREPGDLAPEWCVVDPDAAYHLRRVELTLAAGSVPGFDRFLNHPRGSPIPWPPFADGMFALLGRIFASGHPDDPADRAIGGHDEGDLEAALVHVPPVLGVLTVLAVFAATLGLGDPGPRRAVGASLAALVYATSPVAVQYGEVARIDHHVLVALLLALELLLLSWTLRSREPVDAISGALLGGVICGIGLLTWLAFGIFAGLGGIALFLSASNGDTERARHAARSGVLFFAAAAVTTMIPASASVWNDVQPGSLVNLTEAVPRALLCAAFPFVVLVLLTRAGRSRVLVLVPAVASLFLAVVLLPDLRASLYEGFAWATRDNLFMDVVEESRPLQDATAVRDRLGWPAFLFPPAWLFLAVTSFRRPERLLLVLIGAVTCVMALAQQRFGSDFAVPQACTLGVAIADGLSRSRTSRAASWSFAALSAAGSLACAYGVASVPQAEYRALADWRAEVVRGLRWMRSATPTPGPWNAPERPQEYGVLAHWGMGHLIEYHARRPSIATNFGSFVGEANFEAAATVLLETDPERFVAGMHALGARYVVVTPRNASDLVSLMRIAGGDTRELFVRTADGRKVFGPRATESALARLAFHGEPVGSRHYPGLELIHAAEAKETGSRAPPKPNDARGPVLSIYGLLERSQEAPSPVIESPR